MPGSDQDLSHVPASSIGLDRKRTADPQSAGAIALLNYIDALHEYLQEYPPEPQRHSDTDASRDSILTLQSANRALMSLKHLLQRVGYGRPLDGNETTEIVNKSHAIFLQAGLLPPETAPPFPDLIGISQTPPPTESRWSVPAWCIFKLYEGLQQLVREAATAPPATPTGQYDE